MGVYVAGDAPAMDRRVSEAIKAIGGEIDSLRVPRLQGVVLGGGYGRGEGGVIGGALSNDLDFFAVTEEGASAAEIAVLVAALEPVSRRWTERLGVDVDFTVRTPWRLRHDQVRLMIQELIHGYFDVAGKKGAEMFKGIEVRPPSAFPWSEAVRLLVNRGVGLLLAHEQMSSETTNYQLHPPQHQQVHSGGGRCAADRARRLSLEGGGAGGGAGRTALFGGRGVEVPPAKGECVQLGRGAGGMAEGGGRGDV